MIVKVLTAELLYSGEKASKYLVTVQTKDGKPYAVYTWSKAIGEGIGKEFDVQSEKRTDKFTKKDQNFIKQVGAGGGNGAWRKSADNSVATALNCACVIHAAQIRQGSKYSPGELLIMADNFLTWMKAKE